MQILSVTQINTQIKTLVETTFLSVCVEGEISNLTKHSSGHIYFSIKDENSAIKCVMFKGNTLSLKFELENNQKVIISGALSVYIPRGEYQIIAKNIEPSGIGALSLAYEQLKDKLSKKGYFDSSVKKIKPSFPKKIAILTSSTGAALQDMLKVASNRWTLSKIVLIDTLVQGEGAKFDIVKNIKYADSFYGSKEAFDVIIIGRGGGSIEDLWAFNEEIVAEAIFNAKTFIVSAVGHEIDFVISDFVSDLRAPTPSACMEMILPDMKEWLIRLDDMSNALNLKFKSIIEFKEETLKNMSYYLKQISYEVRFQKNTQELIELEKHLDFKINNFLEFKSYHLKNINFENLLENLLNKKDQRLKEIKLFLEGKNPSNFVKSGYVQILHENKIIALKDLKNNDEIELVDTNMSLNAKIIS